MLLLRAAYKFRDLCHQSEVQLRQFMTSGPQREETNENVEIHLTSESEDQRAETPNEMGEGQISDGGFVIEESVTEYDDTSYVTEPNLDSKNDDYITAEEDDIEIQELSDFENSEFIVEEVGVKDYVNEGDTDETMLKYERDLHEDNIIFEDVTKKSERQMFKKRIIERKPSVKRKRKQTAMSANDEIYNCMLCENTYTDKTKYNNHMKIHARDKPHECEYDQF